MVFLKVNRIMQFTTSSGNKLQPLMIAGKKCLNVSVVQIGRLSDFELLIRVFLVLKCRCETAAAIATRPLIILKVRKDGVHFFFLRVVSNQVVTS